MRKYKLNNEKVDLNLLIVYEEESVAETLSSHLVRDGYKCICTNSYKSSIDTIKDKRNKIDIIIIYYMRFGIATDSYIKEIKNINEEIHIILFGGFTVESNDYKNYYNMDVDVYEDDKYDFNEIISKIKKIANLIYKKKLQNKNL